MTGIKSSKASVLIGTVIGVVLVGIFGRGTSHGFKSFQVRYVVSRVNGLRPGGIGNVLTFTGYQGVMLIGDSPAACGIRSCHCACLLDGSTRDFARIMPLLAHGR